MNMSRKLKVAALSFAYVMTAVSPAMADDTEIYIGGSAATGGAPNVLLLLDNSGSMKYPMYTYYPEGHPLEGQAVPKNGSNATNPDDQRGSHLKEAAKRLLENMNGDIRVGIASYNQYGGEGYGGRIRYPVRRLDDSVSSSSTGVEERSYIVSASADDASQAGSQGSSIVTSQSELPLGDSPNVTVTITADNYAYQRGTSTSNSNNTESSTPIAFGGGTGSSSTYSAGFRFPGITIPRNATIISASFDLTHCGSCATTGGIANNANGVLSYVLQTENRTSNLGLGTQYAARVYSDSSPISSRSYSGGLASALSVAATELLSSSPSKTVDVKTQIQSLVNSSSWNNTTNDIAFALVPNNSSYSAAKGRLLKAPTVLKIVYNEGGSGDTFAGVRFQSVDIPRGATIDSAELVFQPSRNGSSSGTWEIGLEKSSEAIAFSSNADAHLDSSRWTGAYVKSYSPGNWVAGTDVAIDVKSLLTPLVASTGFCGGGNVAFRIRDTSAGARRYAISYDDDQVAAPRLKVKYTLPTGSTCLRSSRIATVRSSNDDAEQTGSVQETVALNVPLRSSSKVGLRFSGISIPQGATIRSATLKLKAANEPSSRGTFTIKAAKLTDIGEFSDSNKIGSITDLTSASVAWSPSAWKTGSTYESGDLKTVIQEVVNQAGWNAGNALALIVNGSLTGSSYPRAYQADYGASAAASLSIVYDSDNPADAVRRVRQDLLDLIKNYTFTTSTPLGEAYYETARYMLGYSAQYGKSSLWPDAAASQNSSQVYISPMDGGQCQSNNIIMLTDGEPTDDADNKSVGAACSSPFDCMNKNAEYLKKTGKTGSSGEKSLVTTYTVGFGPDVNNPSSSAYKGLANVARVYGGGEFFAASDADSLSDSFKTIFSRIADTSGTMASPGVAVNQLNRSQHLDQLYYGVFEPTTNSRWAGNLKRYRLGADDSVQATNGDAIDPKTKFFSTNAQSWWSDVVDGNKVNVGGAAGEQTAARTVYVDNGTGPMTLLDVNNPPSGLTADLVQWIQGLDVDDVDSNGITNEARKAMGAPIHGQPTMVSYGSGTEDYVVFIGSNDGLLHSINVNNGSENWAWLPRELINNVPVLRNNPGMGSVTRPLYGLDGNWTVAKVGSDTLLIGGMRQGGSNIYAVKLPTTRTGIPELKWKITPATTGFSRLGYTWSQPVLTRVRIGGQEKDVVVFGGGLDYSTYEIGGSTVVASTGNMGNAVYMVDAATGSLVWSAASGGATGSSYTSVSQMQYSVPGGVRVMDKNADRMADHLYFGDVGGQLFRVDIDNTSSAPRLVKRVAPLAKLGAAETSSKANDRRIYEMPAVAYIKDSAGKIYAAVTVGTGNRNYPKSDRAVQDRFYMVKDYDAARFDILGSSITDDGDGSGATPDLATFRSGALSPFVTSDLTDVTSKLGATATTAVAASKGWYINMPAAAEKVLSAPMIFSKRNTANDSLIYEVHFNSFAPDSSASSACTPVAGQTNAWSVLLSNGSGSPTNNLNTDGSTVSTDRYDAGVANGIAGTDVGLIRENAQGDLELKKVTGTRAEAAGQLPPGFGRIIRSRWYDRQTQ